MLGMQSVVTAPRNVAVRKNRQTEEVWETMDMRNKAELSHETSLGRTTQDLDKFNSCHDGERMLVGSVLSGRGHLAQCIQERMPTQRDDVTFRAQR